MSPGMGKLRLVILGSSNAIPDPHHENTHMALLGEEHFALIDCVSNPIVRLKQAGLELLRINDLILTHFHPDHVSGVPLLLMDSWLLGRQHPLGIHGLEYTLDRLERLMDDFGWSRWPGTFPIRAHIVHPLEHTLVLENTDFRILASPVQHVIPNIGLRIESRRTGRVVVYSSDTQPAEEVVRLASGANILIHEASGLSYGHSSAGQAGEIARQSGVEQLYLIHYPTWDTDPRPLVEDAKQTFGGKVKLAEDFMEIEF